MQALVLILGDRTTYKGSTVQAPILPPSLPDLPIFAQTPVQTAARGAGEQVIKISNGHQTALPVITRSTT